MPSRRDIRTHAVSLAIASWVVFAWMQATPGSFDRFGTLRGVDFLQFYAAGRVVGEGRTAQLYDWELFAARLPHLVEGLGAVLYLPIYPPQLALLFAPLARHPYLGALAIWTAISAGLYAASVVTALRLLPVLRAYRVEAWALATGFPPFLQLVAHGQIASLALLPLLGAFAALRRGNLWLLGAALGTLAFKPQLGTFALAALVVRPSARLLTGLVLGLVLQCTLVVAVLGPQVFLDYIDVAQRVLARPEAFEPNPWAMHGLRGALELSLGRGSVVTGLWMAGAIAALWLARRAWRAHESRSARFAALCLAALVINPHLYIYDLLLLAVPLACLAAWLLERAQPGDRYVVWTTYALVWLPLLGPIAETTRVQPTPYVILALLWMLGSITASHEGDP